MQMAQSSVLHVCFEVNSIKLPLDYNDWQASRAVLGLYTLSDQGADIGYWYESILILSSTFFLDEILLV